ncbi:hypothetical protein BDZ91DRAFT_660122 [Kalaharituber pfeilii]|nr:hypothetical protein BDZ91DRAFT_660122 [Kalaharituber pfeilii]
MFSRFLSLRSIQTHLLPFLLLSTLGPQQVLGGDILTTDGFSTCLDTDSVKIHKLQIKYDRSTNLVTFDVAGSSLKTQNVTAVLKVTAYGRLIDEKKFDPCKEGIEFLCPVPEGRFSANDTLVMPEQFASQIPAIAFQVPDLDGMARLELLTPEGDTVACVESVVNNGKTANQPAVSYVTAGIAAAALALSAISAVGAAGAGGSSVGASPNFGDVMFWFQSVATNGMLSVDYPPVYRSFAKNFAWSTGLVEWTQVQKGIDSFREATGGNITEMSVEYLMNATLVYTRNGVDIISNTKRSLETFLYPRQEKINFDHSNVTESEPEENSKIMHYVNGIEAYVEELKIPSANTFMTVLLIFAIVIAALAALILLFKVILEVWALFASFPKRLTGFRKRYWGFLAATIVRIILILYGTWTLYCLYQFTRGDSWAAHLLAAITLVVFTGILGFFVVKIFLVARRVKKLEGNPEGLFLNKPYMRRYGLFYDQFKSQFWWIFLPLILYAFMKAAFIALGDGHGLIQAAGQLGCELILLILLLWSRPFNTRSGNVLNIIISVVRVLSVVCLLVFVHELGIAADAKTVTGVALIAIQSTLTAVLAILLAINAIVIMCKDNPYEKRRKELEKQREADNLTPLDPRNSLLLGKGLGSDGKGYYRTTPTQDTFFPIEQHGSSQYPMQPMARQDPYGGQTPYMHHERTTSEITLARHSLMAGAAPPAQHPASYDEYNRRSY